MVKTFTINELLGLENAYTIYEANRKKQKEYYLKNKTKILSKQAEYYLKNRTKILTKQRLKNKLKREAKK